MCPDFLVRLPNKTVTRVGFKAGRGEYAM